MIDAALAKRAAIAFELTRLVVGEIAEARHRRLECEASRMETRECIIRLRQQIQIARELSSIK